MDAASKPTTGNGSYRRLLALAKPYRWLLLAGLLAMGVEAAAGAGNLELQASGGKAYLTANGSGFARRWRESAFVPIVTPSLVQLRTELQRQAAL